MERDVRGGYDCDHPHSLSWRDLMSAEAARERVKEKRAKRVATITGRWSSSEPTLQNFPIPVKTEK